MRVIVGLALVPHGLRNTFNFFPTTGQPMRSIGMLADYMDKQGYRPGMVWAPAISLTQLICGPLLALGLFTRLAAVPIVLFLLVSNIERWRVGKLFLEPARPRIHADVDDRGALLSRARRREPTRSTASSSAANSDLAGLPERLTPRFVRWASKCRTLLEPGRANRSDFNLQNGISRRAAPLSI